VISEKIFRAFKERKIVQALSIISLGIMEFDTFEII